jgi:hypothetical protein
LTVLVELDVAVDVEPIVDLVFDRRSRFLDEDSETKVYVQRRRWSRRLRQPFRSRSCDNVNVKLNVFARFSSPVGPDLKPTCDAACAP